MWFEGGEREVVAELNVTDEVEAWRGGNLGEFVFAVLIDFFYIS